MLRAIVAPFVLAASLAGCSDRTADAARSTTTVTYSVEGMHCHNCAEAITARVSDLHGVSSCEVSLEQKSMTVATNDSTAQERVADAVKRLGYTATARR